MLMIRLYRPFQLYAQFRGFQPSTTVLVATNMSSPSSSPTRLQGEEEEEKCKSKPRALVILAEGAEEMEVVITVDVLRRGGIHVTLAGLDDSGGPVKCSRDVVILPDKSLSAALTPSMGGPSPSFDVIILPGGMMAAKTLAGSARIGQILKRQEAEALAGPPEGAKKYLAAICAGPLAFLSHGIGRGHHLTSHPGVADQFRAVPDLYTYVEGGDDDVVVDDFLVTSRGPGTAFAFGLALVSLLQCRKVADSLVEPMMLTPIPKY